MIFPINLFPFLWEGALFLWIFQGGKRKESRLFDVITSLNIDRNYVGCANVGTNFKGYI